MKFSAPVYRIARGLIAILAILIIGTLGYRIIGSWSFIDSFYMTVITISTVGYNEVHPLTPAGRIFSIFLIFGGVGTAIYILTTGIQYLIEGEFGIRIGRQRMETKIGKLRNHFILCGYGRVGQEVAHALKQESVKFVVIDKDTSNVARAQQSDYLAIQDDATRSEVLVKARIDNARGLIVALGDDAENTYTTLVAHGLNPALNIIARASNDEAMKRLRHAGANHVISPEVIGGQRMARLAVRPAAIQFIETVFSSHEEEMLVEEIKLNENSPLAGSTVKQIEDRFMRIKILAKKQGDAVVLDPSHQTVIDKGDVITAFGPSKELQALEGCCEQEKSATN
jgi:voltage-gated potassium channel